jgi:CrcB protein
MLYPFLLVGLGGALGAITRYLLVTVSQYIFGLAFPYGTLIANALGAFCIGFFMYAFVLRFSNYEWLRLFVVVGFLGGLTTFSSYAWETYALYQSQISILSLLNIVLSNVLCLFFVVMGASLSHAIFMGFKS